jgi:hypothetical protein
MKVLIFGSCVSRDILNFDKLKELSLVDYFARSSLASAFRSQPVADNYSKHLKSEFQRRLVNFDFSKNFRSEVLKVDYDKLVIDFIDERFDLHVFPGGQIVTLSSELLSTGFLRDSPPGTQLKSGSQEFFDVWKDGWSQLVKCLRDADRLDRLVINRVFWSHNRNEIAMPEMYSKNRIADANALLEKMYRQVENDLDPLQIMRFPDEIFDISTEHRWGLSPFHYIDDYYVEALMQLVSRPYETRGVAVTRNPHSVKELRLYADTDCYSDGKMFSAFQNKLQFFPRNFRCIDIIDFHESGSITLPVCPGGYLLKLSPDCNIDWQMHFSDKHNSNVMWLLSLDFIGRLISTYEQRGHREIITIIERHLGSYLDFVSSKDGRMYVENIPSSDHSSATRLNVFAKYLLLTMERGWSDNFRCKVFGEFYGLGNWVIDSLPFSRCNHGVMTSAALIIGGKCLGIDLGTRWLSTGMTRLLEIAREAFDEDGLCWENTIGYHNFNLNLYREILKFCAVHDIKDESLSTLELICDKAEFALRYCVRQDRTIPPIGDSPVYQVPYESVNRTKVFSNSGFAVIKSDDLYLSVICGSRSETHKQMDDSSVTLRYRSADIISDGGSYSYDRAAGFGRYVESAVAHSGVFPSVWDHLRRREVLGRFGLIDGKVIKVSESPEFVFIKANYRVSKIGLSVSRSIFVRWPDEICFVDEVNSISENPEQKYVQRFLLGPNVSLVRTELNTFSFSAGPIAGCIFFEGEVDPIVFRGQDSPDIRGWYSVKNGEILPTSTLEFKSSTSSTRFATLIALNKGSLMSCSDETLSFYRNC